MHIPNTRKTLELMASDPTVVDQATWLFRTACKTTACMAGHASTLAGEWTTDGYGDPVVQLDSGGQASISDTAMRVLGFDEDTADAFFMRTSGLAGRQAVAVLYRMAEIVSNGEITLPFEFEIDYFEAQDGVNAHREMNASRPVEDLATHYLRHVL
jgi:hypothetical protein